MMSVAFLYIIRFEYNLLKPNATNKQYPALGKYKTLSAITNPTLKKILVAGTKGIITSARHIIRNLSIENRKQDSLR